MEQDPRFSFQHEERSTLQQMQHYTQLCTCNKINSSAVFMHFAECLRFTLADFYVSCMIAELACHIIEVIGAEYHVLRGQHAQKSIKQKEQYGI